MNLKYDLFKFDEAFAFQITYQSSKVREFLSQLGGTYHAFNGWNITSIDSPEISLDGRTIYLRGLDASKDLRVHREYNLPSNYQRDIACAVIDSALREFNNRLATLEIVSDLVFPLGFATTASKPVTGGGNVIHEDKPVISA